MKRPGAVLAFVMALAGPAASFAQDIASVPVNILIEERILDAQFGLLPTDANIVVESGDGSIEGIAIDAFDYDPASGRFAANVRTSAGESIRVPGRVSILVPTHVPVRRIPAGEIVTIDDLRVVDIPLAIVTPGMLRAQDDILGKQVRRTLMQDRPIQSQSVMIPRAVSKGETVEIQYEFEGLRLSAPGKTMEDGAVGDVVRILNTSSRKTIMAEVVSPGRVMISSPQY